MSWRVAATLAVISWGALAFGAVYPWAFDPLFIACGLIGAAELIMATGRSTRIGPAFSLALGLLVLAI